MARRNTSFFNLLTEAPWWASVVVAAITYESTSLHKMVHRLGDKVLFFGDEIKYSRRVVEIARFSIKLDDPYTEELASLGAYELGGELLGRGIVNDNIFTVSSIISIS